MSFRESVLYPFLLSLYFVLLVLSENLGEAYLGQTVRAILVLLCLTGLFLLLFSWLFGNTQKAAFVTALLLTFIFVVPGLEGFLPWRVRSHKLLLLVFEIVGFVTVTVLLLRTLKDWAIVDRVLSIIVGVMLVLTLYRIGSYGLSDSGLIFEPAAQPRAVSAEGFHQPDGEPPDIYYLLVDAYTRADTLQDYFGYDNSGFIEFLEGKGFMVGSSSVANYNLTRLAVSSLLNLEYMADEDGIKPVHPNGYPQVLMDKTFNSKVAGVLKQLGYQIVTVRSSGGRYVNTADAEDFARLDSWLIVNEFESALLDTTLLPRIFSRRMIRKLTRDIFSRSDRMNYVFEEIPRQLTRERPMFLIAHIEAPHQPFIYDRNGDVPDISDADFGKLEHLQADVRAYADQVHYLNILLHELIENILDKSETPPIIILQGDHGLRLTWWDNRQLLDDRRQLEDVCQREVFSILNALYLPDSKGRAAFYDSMSPVNTFRLIFDTYFGGELGMLDDRSFFFNLE